MLTESRIENFLVLANELSFSRAAAKLFITQQTLSYQIAALEADVGGALFIRTTKSVQLTPLGNDLKRLFEKTKKEYHRILDCYTEQERSLIRICCLADMDIAQELHNAKRSFQISYPQTQFRFLYMNTFNEILNGLENNEFDIALFPEGVKLSSHTYHVLMLTTHDPLFICYSPTLCREEGKPSIRDLEGVPFYVGTDTETVQPIITEVCRQNGFTPTYYNGPPVPPSVERLIIEGGEGAGLGGRFSVLNRNSSLVKVELEACAPMVAAWKERPDNSFFEAFGKSLRDSMK